MNNTELGNGKFLSERERHVALDFKLSFTQFTYKQILQLYDNLILITTNQVLF